MQVAEAALRYLRDICTEYRVLLFIDDIRAQQPLPKPDDKSLDYLKTLNASILFASRVPFPQFDHRNVEVLPAEECIKIFERQYGRCDTGEEERTLLTRIIEEKAGRNTLVVNRLGAMAKDPGWSIKELFGHLETQKFSIPKGAVDDEPLQLEINKLYTIDETFTPAEINILEAFSIFPAIPLALGLCKEWLSEDAGVEPDECARKLAGLAQKTWLIQHESEEGVSSTMYSMHQVVREAVKGQVTIVGSTHLGMIDACTKTLRQSTNEYNFAIAAQTIPFAITNFQEIYEENATTAVLTDAIGNYYGETAAYSLAMQWQQKAATLAEKVFGIEHNNTATAYNNIAQMYYEQGEYVKALEWFFKSLEIKEKVLGKGNTDTATTYNNIALTYTNQAEYPKALEWCFKALRVYESVHGKEHPDTATVYNNIALIFEKQGDHSTALEWYFKALAIREKVQEKEHPAIATTYNNIGGVYDSQGDYPKALEWYFKALEIKERVLGKEHPDTAVIYNNIAWLYYKQGNYQAALEWLQKALPILEAKRGHEHPYTKIALDGIELVTAKLASNDRAK